MSSAEREGERALKQNLTFSPASLLSAPPGFLTGPGPCSRHSPPRYAWTSDVSIQLLTLPAQAFHHGGYAQLRVCPLCLSIRETHRKFTRFCRESVLFEHWMLGLWQQRLVGKEKEPEPRCGQDNGNSWSQLSSQKWKRAGKAQTYLEPALISWGPKSVGRVSYNGGLSREVCLSPQISVSWERYFRSDTLQIIKKLNFSNKLFD